MTIKLLDLFAGAGGLSLGFELLKDEKGKNVFEMYRAVEIDKYACETLRKRYGKERVIEGDLTLSETHKRVIKECKGKVSVVIGGIPCQSFSMIGPRSGYGKKMKKFKQDRRDHLYLEFKKIVDELDPDVIVMENVKGILSKKDSGGKKIIDTLIADFKTKYNFQNDKDAKDYMVLNSLKYGVPQKRERVLIIGIRKAWKNISVPYPIETYAGEGVTRDSACKLHQYVTIFDAINDLPKVESPVTKTGLNKNQIAKIGLSNKTIDRGIDEAPYDSEWSKAHLKNASTERIRFFKFIRPNSSYLHHHIARAQQKSDILLFSLLKPGETAKDFALRMPKRAKNS